MSRIYPLSGLEVGESFKFRLPEDEDLATYKLGSSRSMVCAANRGRLSYNADGVKSYRVVVDGKARKARGSALSGLEVEIVRVV